MGTFPWVTMHVRSVIGLLAVLCLWSVSSDGRHDVTHSLVPEGLETVSLAQVVTMVGTSSKTSVEVQEAYRQLGASVQLLANMRSQLHADQAQDDQQTTGVNTGSAAEEIALVIAADRISEAFQRQEELVSRTVAQKVSAIKAAAIVNSTMHEMEDGLAKTNQDCQAILDHRHARIASAKNDLDTVVRIEGNVAKIHCPKEAEDSEQTTTLFKFAQFKPTGVNVDPLKMLSDCGPGGCQVAGMTGNIVDTDVHYACTTRKSAIAKFISDLKAQLYGLASQDTHTFEQTYTLCAQEAAVKKESLAVLHRKQASLRSDVDTITASLATANDELASLLAAKQAAQEVLQAHRTSVAKHTCRFEKRSTMRTHQVDLVGHTLQLLKDLSESPYASTHLNLTAGCSPKCRVHGMCFRGVCHCDDGWKGINCSVSTSAGKCHFNAGSEPCTGSACAAYVSTGTLRTVEIDSPCASTICEHCRETADDNGCKEAQTALFCAEKQRRDGCDSLTCIAPTDDDCGTKRIVRTPFRGCCFNPILDCEDKCTSVACPITPPSCPDGFMVRFPLRDCCFDVSVDCVDVCSVAECPTVPAVCPAGKIERHPYIGCCFNASLDCDDDCADVVCGTTALPSETCAAQGKRWSGHIQGCCFNASIDCLEGDLPGQETERAGLLQLYSGTSGSSWTRHDNWDSELWLCYWYGVECAGPPSSMRVSELVLPDNNLVGTPPAGLFQLTGMRVLDLSDNHIEGPVPGEWSQLSSLEVLKLRGNVLTGVVPSWMTSLPSLMLVYIDFNYFTDWEGGYNSIHSDPDRTFSCGNTCLCTAECSPRNIDSRGGQSCQNICA